MSRTPVALVALLAIHRRYVAFAALSLVTLACSGDGPTVVISEISSSVTPAQTCTTLHGSAVDVQHDFKALHARLEGDAAGTLQILERSQVQVGAVERASADFTLDLEAGAILFGDGIAGRVPPSGGVQTAAYRYHAEGRISSGTGAYSHVSGQWEVNGWLSAGTPATSLDYRMLLCTD